MAEEKKSIVDATKNIQESLKETVQRRYMEKYADEAIQLLGEFKKLEKAVKKYEDWIRRLDEGDATVLEEYKKKRKQLEDEEDSEL